jgi:hypothetical protein
LAQQKRAGWKSKKKQESEVESSVHEIQYLVNYALAVCRRIDPVSAEIVED